MSLDIERGVLGAVLVDNTVWERVAALRSDDFSLEAHRRIYATMSHLRETGRPIDMLNVSECLDRNKEIEAIGGVAYLSSLIDGELQSFLQRMVGYSLTGSTREHALFFLSAIQGCLDWQREGLNPPPVVREATTDYLAAEDAIGRWLDDRCVVRQGCWTTAGALFADWQSWCQQTGEPGFSQKRFTQQLEARGLERARTSRAKGFNGIGLRDGLVPDVPGSPIFPVSRARVHTPYIEESGTSGTYQSGAGHTPTPDPFKQQPN